MDACLREPVVPNARRAMTPARKARIWHSRDGKCWMCGKPVDKAGPEVVYDHRIPLELGGADDDSNLYPLHRKPCDELKTKADRRRIDKMRRQRALSLDVERTVSPSWGKSRGFGQAVRVPARRKGR